MADRFQILALDGGGLKGLFAAAVLAKIEEDSGSAEIADHFDLITGTSTGAIIAIALGLGMRPRQIVQFYVSHGQKIFPHGRWTNAYRKLRQLARAKYGNEQLLSSLRECFGDKLLGHCRKRLVVPSYNLGQSEPYLFKTAHHERFARDYKVPAWKVAAASCSASTYLPAFVGLDSIRLIDGGVWANNPCMVGVVEAVAVLGIPVDAIAVFSIGTTDDLRVRNRALDTGGFWQWRSDAADVIMRGQSSGAHQQAGLLLGKDRYSRLNPQVPPDFYRLDQASVDDHLAMAAHCSRHFTAEFKSKFGNHRAGAFGPAHNP